MKGIKNEQIEIPHEDMWKYSSVSTIGDKRFANVTLVDGEISESSYSDKYQREHGLGKYAKKESESSKKKNKKSSSYNDSDEEGYCVKLIFTILPILPIWWILKLPISLITFPFRAMCCSDNSNLLPTYSFKKF